MNYRIDVVVTSRGEVRHELRIWAKGRGGKQFKRRYLSKEDAVGAYLHILKNPVEINRPKKLSVRTFETEYIFWREHRAEKEFSAGWLVDVDTYWKQLKPKLAAQEISKCDEEFLKGLEVWLQTEFGNSHKTINNKIGFVQAVLNFSVEMKRISQNPAPAYRKLNHRPKDILFLEREEISDFLGFLDRRYSKSSAERWRFVACLLAANTGLRAGEIWGLRGFNLKANRAQIRVAQQWNRVSKSFELPKGKEARSVPLNVEVLQELEALTHDRRLEPTDLLFSVRGKPIDHDTFRDWFGREISAWGGTRITFHGLRHTAATLMLEAGLSVATVKDILGHKNISTTMRYVHALSTGIVDAAKIFTVSPLAKPLKLVN